MRRALDVLAEKTQGKSFKTKSFCYEDYHSPDSIFEIPNYEIVPKDFGETNHISQPKNLFRFAQKIQGNPPLFSYFLDGSRRTYKIDDVQYGKRIYPIVAGQIGIGCCRRAKKELTIELFEQKIVLVLPECANANRERYFWESLKSAVNKESTINSKYHIKIDEILYYADREQEDYEDSAIIEIQNKMVDLEKKVVADMTRQRLLSQDKRLIKDGSLEYQKMKTGNYRDISKIKNNYRWVVGVSKKFNPEMCVDNRKKSIAAKIAELPLYHRTPAFKFESLRSHGEEGAVYVTAWYLRIRDSKYTQSPFDGIVKVEKILITDSEMSDGLETEEVDIICANLINERNPVCYKIDTRWANHLYPVYLTESFVKSRYLSNNHLINAL